MAEKNFKVNEPIQLIYQAPNKQSGLTVIAEIYLPNGTKDSSFPDLTLDERGATGTYVGEFTPNAAGEWQAIVHTNTGQGQVTKRFSVGNYNVEAVGQTTTNVKAQLDIVEGKIDSLAIDIGALDTPPMVS